MTALALQLTTPDLAISASEFGGSFVCICGTLCEFDTQAEYGFSTLAAGFSVVIVSGCDHDHDSIIEQLCAAVEEARNDY